MKNKILFILTFYASLSFAQINIPVDFELSNTDYFLDFGGCESTVGTDPTSATNTVAITTRTANAETWAGTVIGGTGFAAPIPFSSVATTISLRVYSAYPGVAVHLKAEDIVEPTIFVETRMYTTKTNEWETLVFDFSEEIFNSPSLNLNNSYSKLIVFFNFGIAGPDVGVQDFYWDDIAMGGTSTTLDQIDLPVTFESPTTSYALVDFENNISTLASDPIDPNQTVAMTTKPINASPWSGTIIGTRNGFVNTIPFSATATKVKMRVYSPAINTPILLKVEVANNPTQSVETVQFTTTANEWEVIEWDFLQNAPSTPVLDLSLDYSLLAVFFNFAIDGNTAGETVYYWDDVIFENMTKLETINNLSVSAFPNPVTDKIQISIDGKINAISVYNTLGQLVLNKEVVLSENVFDLSELASGAYFMKLRTEEGEGVFMLVKD